MATERCPRCSARRIDGANVCPRCQWRFAALTAPVPIATDAGRSGASRCPSCSRYVGLDSRFCPHCGIDLARPAAIPPPDGVPRANVIVSLGARSPGHRIVRLLLTIWLVAYPVVACAPVLLGAAAPGSGGGYVALAGLLTGAVLFWPWVVGIIVMGLLTILTR